MLALLTALVFGILHSFGPDHLAAVSTFVSQRRRLRPALGVSLRWGGAHLISVLLLGLLISALAAPLPTRWEPYAEFAAGWVLLCVGMVSLRRNLQARKLHFHSHRHGALVHAHWHSHAHGEEHLDSHAVAFTGLVHGLAGAVPAIALFPLAVIRSPWLMGAYLAVFGFGVILGMAGYCLALSGLLRHLSERHLRRWAQPVIAGCSCALGIVWMVRTGLLFG